MYRKLVDQKEPARMAARSLNKPWSTIKRHVQALLKIEAVRYQGGGPAYPGAVQFFERGPGAESFEAGWVGANRTGGSGLRPPTLSDTIHRGRRSIPIVQVPEQPEKAPGWMRTRRPSGVPNFFYGHMDDDGRRWLFQAAVGRKKRSVMVFPPPFKTTDPAMMATAKTWWTPWVLKEAHRWALRTGYTLANDLAQVKISQPIEHGLDAKAPHKSGVPGVDAVWIDDTPNKGTVETSDDDLAADLAQAPAEIWAIKNNVRAAESRIDATASVLADLQRVTTKLGQAAESVAHTLSNQTRALAALLDQAGGAPEPSPRPSPLPAPSVPGVEYS